MARRKVIPSRIETAILTKSQRRCVLCFGLHRDAEPKPQGQIAHIDRDRANNTEDNLAYLCLPHHDAYDAKSSQSKNYTPGELKMHRDRLYSYLSNLDALNHQITEMLQKENVTVQRLVVDPLLRGLKKEVSEAVGTVLDHIREVQTQGGNTSPDPERFLQLAKAYTVAGDWRSAAEHYDAYVKLVPDKWEVHFLRAVAHANTRGGHATDLAALRAYGDATALVPDTVDVNTRARLYTYRGAMLKRLGRLDEALSDLLLSRQWAKEPYEIVDNLYNLACVHAMRQDKESMMKCLTGLSLAPQYKEVIRRSPYFKNFRNDEDFQDWLD